MKYFGGIEGGATHSNLVICNELGEACATVHGRGTNHWVVGIPEVVVRINEMVTEAKKKAGIPENTRLSSMGLALSGCEQEATNCKLEEALRSAHPDIADSYFVCSDTIGSVFTASPNGGLVVIAGTGSNALLRNPDGSTFTCGGWGHFLGDEGSAWYISHRAMKIVFDDMDGFRPAPHPIDATWKLIKEVFKVEERLDLLSHCYDKFDKTHFASTCSRLADLARAGDALACYIFQEAGQDLARSINALLPRVHEGLVVANEFKIVCVGGVWKSWDLLKTGFLEGLQQKPLRFDLSLVTITKPMAFGACYVGADAIKFPLPRNYADNFQIKDSIKRRDLPAQTNGHSK